MDGPKKADKPEKPDFEHSLARLEEIVRKLESANLPLDEAMKLFEEGMELSRDCQQQLEQAGARPPESTSRLFSKKIVWPSTPRSTAFCRPPMRVPPRFTVRCAIAFLRVASVCARFCALRRRGFFIPITPTSHRQPVRAYTPKFTTYRKRNPRESPTGRL